MFQKYRQHFYRHFQVYSVVLLFHKGDNEDNMETFDSALSLSISYHALHQDKKGNGDCNLRTGCNADEWKYAG